MTTPETPDRIPEAHLRARKKAVRLAWVTIVYLATAATLLGMVMGSSQALKTEWVDDLVSMVPPIAFLASRVVVSKTPTARFPYGYHRASTLAFFASAVALLGVGGYLLIDGVAKLVSAERVTLGGFPIFGHVIWRGWPAMAALLYSAIPAYFLGRAKKKVAAEMNDLGLQADAEMNRADMASAFAALAGIVGVGFGWWWADAVAAVAISADIIYDGVKSLRRAVHELMDRRPETLEGEDEPIVARVAAEATRLGWVERAAARLRLDGGVILGEVFVVPRGPVDVGELGRAVERLRRLDERLNVLVVPVAELPVANATA